MNTPRLAASIGYDLRKCLEAWEYLSTELSAESSAAFHKRALRLHSALAYLHARNARALGTFTARVNKLS